MPTIEKARIQHRKGALDELTGVVLNPAELGFAVDERRLFIGNTVAEGAPVDENIEIFTEYSTIPYGSLTFTLTTLALTTLVSATTFLTYDSGVMESIRISYKMTQGAIKRTGNILVASDGTNVELYDDYIEIGGTSALTISAIMSGADILLQYTAPTTAATFSFYYADTM